MTRKSTIVALSEPNWRNRFVRLVNTLPDFKVIACASDLMNTYNEVEARLPSVVLISSDLADLPEFEVMRGLFSALDVRWLAVTDGTRSHVPGKARPNVVSSGGDLFSVSSSASQDRLAAQLRSVTCSSQSTPPPMKVKASSPLSVPPVARPKRPTAAPRAAVSPPVASPDNGIILIGSSTGGVDALISILSTFPEACPPTLIVQHTGAGFGESLASLLDRQCAARVSLATQARPLQQGEIVLGAGTGTHLVIENPNNPVAKPEVGPQVSGHLPSVDKLFRSAVPLAKRVRAALLTGMGRDGAVGLKALRDAGAYTIAQDKESSVVFGMPRAAMELGAAEKVLPLAQIGPALRVPRKQRQEVHQ